MRIAFGTCTGNLSVAFDGAAVEYIGGDVQLSVSTAEGAPSSDTVMTIEVILYGAAFTNGRATVTMDFDKTVPAGKIAKVYCVTNNNEDMDAVFAEGKVTFSTNHFSVFAVVFEDVPSPGSSGGDKGGFPIAIAVGGGIAALALIGVAVVLIRRKG